MSKLKDFREAKDLTQQQLADLAGTSQPQIRRLENGERKMTKEWALRLAPHLDADPMVLIFAERDDGQSESGSVTVMGRIGAGAEIMPEFEQIDSFEGLFTVETVLNLPSDVIAFEVDGESMYPKYEPGDIVVCRRLGVAPGEVIGAYAAVQTEDGKRYVKKILRGALPNTFDLESHNGLPIRNVHLRWISPVLAVVPVQQWRKLDGRARQRMLGRGTGVVSEERQRPPAVAENRTEPGSPDSRHMPLSFAVGIAEHVPRVRLDPQPPPAKTAGLSPSRSAKSRSDAKSE